jgi:hypothetical protein
VVLRLRHPCLRRLTCVAVRRAPRPAPRCPPSQGLTFFRSTPGALRCAYSLLLDLSNAAHATNGSAVAGLAKADDVQAVLAAGRDAVWEQARFAGFMPECAGALGLGLVTLPGDTFVTLCGDEQGKVGEEQVKALRERAVAVHASPAPGASLRERAGLLRRVLGLLEEDA